MPYFRVKWLQCIFFLFITILNFQCYVYVYGSLRHSLLVVGDRGGNLRKEYNFIAKINDRTVMETATLSGSL